MDHAGQFILPGEQSVVPGYHIGQAVLPCGTGGQTLVPYGSCGAVYIAR